MMFRYCLASPRAVIEDGYGARFEEPYHPHYNVFPSYRMPVITMEDPKKIRFIRWGFKEFVQGVDQLSPYTNSKGILTRIKDKFQLLNHRVVVPANCIYVWHRVNEVVAIPFLIRLTARNKRPFSLAGYRTLQYHPKTGEPIEAFTLLYRKAEGILQGVCDVVPVILPDRHEIHWLKDNYELGNIAPYFTEELSTSLDYYPIAGGVNDPRNNHPDLARSVGASHYELNFGGATLAPEPEVLAALQGVWETLRGANTTPRSIACNLHTARSLRAENGARVYGIPIQVDTALDDGVFQVQG